MPVGSIDYIKPNIVAKFLPYIPNERQEKKTNYFTLVRGKIKNSNPSPYLSAWKMKQYEN